jgi:hypothetical protein
MKTLDLVGIEESNRSKWGAKKTGSGRSLSNTVDRFAGDAVRSRADRLQLALMFSEFCERRGVSVVPNTSAIASSNVSL